MKASRSAISDQGAAKDPNREADRDAFKHQGPIYHEYDGEVDYVAQDGTVTTYDFIPNGEAIAFPLGTRNIFRTYVAPADFMETVNTPGQMMYAKQEPLKFNRGIELHTQMNAIPFITRPELVVTLTSA